jgi:hypothetical protein
MYAHDLSESNHPFRGASILQAPCCQLERITRTPAYSYRGYIRIFEKSATYVLEVLGGLCPALDRVGQNLAQNVLKTDICSKNSKKIQKKFKKSSEERVVI